MSTTSKTSIGSVTLTVDDTAGLSAGDLLLLERVGNERCELARVLTVDPTEITLDAGVQLEHDVMTVSVIDHDEFRIESSIDNDKYITIHEGILDYTNNKNKIVYVDERAIASDKLYYKITLINSFTEAEDELIILHDEDNFSYITVASFRDETKITSDILSDSAVESALQAGVEFIQDRVFRTKMLETTSADTTFTLDLDNMFIADVNADREVTKDDIIAYELDSNDIATYINYKIVKINADRNRVFFNENVPAPNKTLILSLRSCFSPYDKIRYVLREVNKLFAINYSLRNNMNEQLKRAVTSWSAGGTSVNRDPNSVSSVIEANEKTISNLLDGIISKVLVTRTKLRTELSSLNVRANPRSQSFANYPTLAYNFRRR